MAMLVLCPSRGRPAAAAQLLGSFRRTRFHASTRLAFVVDRDDPTLSEYPAQRIVVEPAGCMGGALRAAIRPDVLLDATCVGMVGDDVRFRTVGWDATLAAELEASPCIAWGDDGHQHDRKVSHWFLSRPIVDALGIAPEGLRHYWMDDYWREVGRAAGLLRYHPEILIEHLHPDAGKAPRDAVYEAAGAHAASDRRWFRRWMRGGLRHDVRVLRRALA